MPPLLKVMKEHLHFTILTAHRTLRISMKAKQTYFLWTDMLNAWDLKNSLGRKLKFQSKINEKQKGRERKMRKKSLILSLLALIVFTGYTTENESSAIE